MHAYTHGVCVCIHDCVCVCVCVCVCLPVCECLLYRKQTSLFIIIPLMVDCYVCCGNNHINETSSTLSAAALYSGLLRPSQIREPLKYGIRNSGITEYGIAEYGIRNNGIWKAACTTPASSHREDETAPHLTKMLAYERKTIGT